VVIICCVSSTAIFLCYYSDILELCSLNTVLCCRAPGGTSRSSIVEIRYSCRPLSSITISSIKPPTWCLRVSRKQISLLKRYSSRNCIQTETTTIVNTSSACVQRFLIGLCFDDSTYIQRAYYTKSVVSLFSLIIGAFMILAASFEFWKRHNNEVVERPTDDEEVRQVGDRPLLRRNYHQSITC